MRKAVLFFLCLPLMASAGAAAEPAKPSDADRKLVCQGPQKMLGSRIKRAGACRPASAADEAAEDNVQRLPIGLQVKAPQREPGQRTPAQ
jgi:hypothetical protein